MDLQAWLILVFMAVVFGGCWLLAALQEARAYRAMMERHERWHARRIDFYAKTFKEKP